MEVRKAIKDSGISLPQASWDLFYAVSGFTDYAEWVSLTVAPDQLWNVVEASIQKSKGDFKSGMAEEFADHIHLEKDQKIDTSLWTPGSIKAPLHFSIRRASHSYCEDWVVDEESGRIFVIKSTT